MMHRDIRAVLFDFDYTLADSSRGVIACIEYALRGLGLPPATPDAVCRTIGLSLEETLVALAGEEQRPRAAEFTRLFVERANEVMVRLTRLYPGVPGLLASLRAAGLRLGIVSNKYRYRIEDTLRRDGLLGAVDTIVGGEDLTAHKPDPEGLLLAAGRMEAPPAEVLYAGDSVVDAEAAQRAAMPFVAVLSGATPAEAFADYAVLATVQRVTELEPLLRNGARPSGG